MSIRQFTGKLLLACTLVLTLAVTAGGCSGDGRTCSDDDDCFEGEVCQSTEGFDDKVCVAEAPADGGTDGESGSTDSSSAGDGDATPVDSRPVDTSAMETGPSDTGSMDTERVDTSRPDVPPADSGTDAGDTCSPSKETCNGIDDDCDGDTDEPKPCPKNKGVCSGAESTCVMGSYTTCGPQIYGTDYEADESTIDGKDNDCDGKTDEVFATVDFQSNDLICGRTTRDDIYCWGSSFRLGNFNVSFPITSGPYVQLGVAQSHICARDTSNRLECWGKGGAGGDRTNPPSGAFIDVDAGGAAACGIANSDRSVECWGATAGSRPGLSCTQLSVNSNYCAVDQNQDIECWGNSIPSELENNAPTGTYGDVETVADFACAISMASGTSAGSVDCWGRGSTPSPPPNLANGFAQVGIGAPVDNSGNVVMYACGLDAQNGSIACWGATSGFASPPSGTFLDIAVGSNGGCAVRDDHTIACWGSPHGPP